MDKQCPVTKVYFADFSFPRKVTSSRNKLKTSFFSCKIKKISHPPLNFNNNSVKQVQCQKHLGIHLDNKLDFCENLQNIFKQVNRTIGLLHKLQNNLPRAPFVTIYKFFMSRCLGGNRRECKLKAEMKELKQDVPITGNKLHHQKQQRKSTQKEKRIMKELGTKMNSREATSKNLRILREQWLDKLH